MLLVFLLGITHLHLLANAPAFAKQPTDIGQIKYYKAKYEDTLLDIARKNNLGFTELVSANPKVDPWLPGKGKKITLPQWHLLPDTDAVGIVINLSEMRLYYFGNETGEIQSFPIGIGREGLETPLGKTKVSWRRSNPTWTPTADMRKETPDLPKTVEAGPNNPLGTHAVYLEWPNYLLHGTARPWGIGRRVSSGCIRLYPEDIKKVFKLAKAKTPVHIVDQPIKTQWIAGVFHIEAHPTIDQIDKIEMGEGLDDTNASIDDLAYIRLSLGQWADDKKMPWKKIKETIAQRKGVPVAIYERPVYEDELLR